MHSTVPITRPDSAPIKKIRTDMTITFPDGRWLVTPRLDDLVESLPTFEYPYGAGPVKPGR